MYRYKVVPATPYERDDLVHCAGKLVRFFPFFFHTNTHTKNVNVLIDWGIPRVERCWFIEVYSGMVCAKGSRGALGLSPSHTYLHNKRKRICLWMYTPSRNVLNVLIHTPPRPGILCGQDDEHTLFRPSHTFTQSKNKGIYLLIWGVYG